MAEALKLMACRGLVALWLLTGLFQCQAYKFAQGYEPRGYGSGYEPSGYASANTTKVPLYKELAAAFPLVLQNLTNYTGLINSKGVESENITHQFGELSSDLAMLSDKVSGFYGVVHEMLSDGSGPFLCPLDKQSRIKECLLLATCLLEYHVPQDIELAHFMSYMEMTQRFIDIGWQALKKALLFEQQSTVLEMDKTAPEKYQCDSLQHQVVAPALLQEHEADGATLAMSSAVVQASEASFQILEAHELGSSVDATVMKLHELWRPVCQRLDCDHSNFWDVHYASYRQTAALLELRSGAAAKRAARREIQHRVKLEKRISEFVAENEHYYSRIPNGTHLPVGRRFVESGFIQEASRAARSQLIARGRNAFMKQIMPTMREIAQEDQQRGTRLFDQVEFHKFRQQRRSQKHIPVAHAEAEEEDAPAGFDDGGLALLETEMDLEEEEEASVESESGRRRRRLIGGRRRSRRRRRFLKEVGRAIESGAKAVGNAVGSVAEDVGELIEDVGEFMESLLSCAGIALEFLSTGYDYEVVPATVSLSMGLSSGIKQALEDIISKKKPRAFISLDFGFAIGITKKLAWTGVGLGGSVSCDSTGSCGIYITIAPLATVNLPTTSVACPMGPNWGAATCAQAMGAGISTMCCTIGLTNGNNDCR